MGFVIKQADGNDVLINCVIKVWDSLAWLALVQIQLLEVLNRIMGNVSKNPVTDEFKGEFFRFKPLGKAVYFFWYIGLFVYLENFLGSVRELGTELSVLEFYGSDGVTTDIRKVVVVLVIVTAL